MTIEIKGTIIKIGDVTKVSDKLSKREVVIETADNPKYPQSIPVELVNDRTSMAEGLAVGDSVRAEVDVRGRAWSKPGGDTKYFLSLNVFKLERVGGEARTATTGGGYGGDAQDQIPF